MLGMKMFDSLKTAPVFALAMCPMIANADSANDITDLLRSIRGELSGYCASGSALTFADDAFVRLPNGSIEFATWKAQCSWADGTPPFCGVRLCSVWTYELRGSEYVLVKDELR